jgi:hypothetical protein
MKTYPANWSEAQISYFAGLLSSETITSGHNSLDDIERILRQHSFVDLAGEKAINFPEVIELLSPFITLEDWNGIVECCERIFA